MSSNLSTTVRISRTSINMHGSCSERPCKASTNHLRYGKDLLYTILKEVVKRNFRFPECRAGAKGIDASCLSWFFPAAPED